MQFNLYKSNVDRVKTICECSCLTPTQAVNSAISFGWRVRDVLTHYGVLNDGSIYCTDVDGDHVFLDENEAEEVLAWILDHVGRGAVGGFRGEMSEEGMEELVIPFFNSWCGDEDLLEKSIEEEERRLDELIEERERKLEEKKQRRKKK